MITVIQHSMIDHPSMIGGARFGVELTTSQIAEIYGLLPERSFDDLDYFEFLCLEHKGVKLAFQHRFQRQSAGSMVSFSELGAHNPIQLIAEVCKVGLEEIHVFDEARLAV